MSKSYRLCQPTKQSVAYYLGYLLNIKRPMNYDELYDEACKKYGGNLSAVCHHQYCEISDVINDLLEDNAKRFNRKKFLKKRKDDKKKSKKQKRALVKATAKKHVLRDGFVWSIAQGHKFYASIEWKRIRYAVLKEHGTICQCCGQGRNTDKGIQIHVDHIKSLRKFPELRLDKKNLQVLCSDCNSGKGNIDDTDWR